MKIDKFIKCLNYVILLHFYQLIENQILLLHFSNQICFCCFSVAFYVQMTDFFSTKLSQIFPSFFFPFLSSLHCTGLFVLRLPCITGWLYIHCVVEHDLQLQIFLGCIFPCWDYRKTGSGHVTQNWLGSVTLLFQPSQCWNCRHVPCLSFFNEKNFNSNYSAVSLNLITNVTFYFSHISETVESTQITSALISK